MDGELTVTYLSIDGSEQIPRRHRNRAVLSDTKMARVNDSECTGITRYTPDDSGFG